ncbi:MAG: glycosyltransferase family 2 protein [Clostridia bacterium]|nr:glycosyltransferase family 2 protein [Clostridia bacterium]
MSKELVSIVIPVYNAEKFLDDTIKCVLGQTYTNWEVLLINDCSKDKSKEIAQKYLNEKIKWFDQEKNGGPAIARNKGIELAKGRYICYLDADDLWNKEKLEKQVNFMQEKDCEFSFTGYEFANSEGVPNGKKVYVPEKITYKQALKNTTIWTTTAMFDMKKLTKEDIYMIDVKSEDTATWWKILKKIDYAYGLNEILAYYRRTEGTLSSNKFQAIKRIWNLYRNVEHLNLFSSCYNFIIYAIRAVLRRT